MAKQEAASKHYMCHVQVLAPDVAHSSPSLLLSVEREGRFLFNGGEGIQRLFRENKFRMQKMDNLFVTRVSTETMAGIPGLFLSMGANVNDAGGLIKSTDNPTTVYGPKRTSAFITAAKNYLNQDRVLKAVDVPGPGEQPALLKNSALQVIPIVVHPRAAEAGAGAGEAKEEPEAKRPRLGPALPEAPHQQEVVCYVCEMAGTPGKFDPRRAAELGVTRGPNFGLLQKGNVVKNVHGQDVFPHQVMDNPVLGPLVVVVDVPSEAHLQRLVEDRPFARWEREAEAEAQGAGAAEAGKEGAKRTRVMAHFAPYSLASSPAYAAWKESLGPGWTHVLCASGAPQPTMLRRATLLQAKLHCLSPQVFPLLQPACAGAGTGSSAPAPANGSADAGAQVELWPARSGVRFHVLPAKSVGPDAAAASSDVNAASAQAEFRDRCGAIVAMASQEAGSWPPREALERAAEQARTSGAGAGMDVDAPAVAPAASGGAGQGTEPAVKRPPSAHELAEAAAIATVPPPAYLQGLGREEFELTFLGTASSCPSKYRNVTALLCDFFARGTLLLDCGEDTLGQICRRLGAEGAAAAIARLRCVWVSHMHADHHGGLYRLIQLHTDAVARQRLRKQAQQGEAAAVAAAAAGADAAEGLLADLAAHEMEEEPLLVIGPWPLMRVLSAYREALPGLQFHFLPNAHLAGRGDGKPLPPPVQALFDKVKQQLGLAQIKPTEVHHVAHSYGIRLQSEAGWSVAFSGDSRPCPNMVEAARGATLLVHEATFEDELAKEAVAKKHSTTSEALGVSKQSGAYRTVLTHFSTRYPELPVADFSLRPDVAVAMDFMSINLKDLPWLPSTVKPLGALFAEAKAEFEAGEAEDVGAGAEAGTTPAPPAAGGASANGGKQQQQKGGKQQQAQQQAGGKGQQQQGGKGQQQQQGGKGKGGPQGGGKQQQGKGKEAQAQAAAMPANGSG